MADFPPLRGRRAGKTRKLPLGNYGKNSTVTRNSGLNQKYLKPVAFLPSLIPEGRWVAGIAPARFAVLAFLEQGLSPPRAPSAICAFWPPAPAGGPFFYGRAA